MGALIFTPSFAPGLYHKGDGKDLGHALEFKSEILRVVFSDGNEYEYYGVPKAIYVKLVNSDTPDRFARRHIYENYLYRSTSKIVGDN